MVKHPQLPTLSQPSGEMPLWCHTANNTFHSLKRKIPTSREIFLLPRVRFQMTAAAEIRQLIKITLDWREMENCNGSTGLRVFIRHLSNKCAPPEYILSVSLGVGFNPVESVLYKRGVPANISDIGSQALSWSTLDCTMLTIFRSDFTCSRLYL